MSIITVFLAVLGLAGGCFKNLSTEEFSKLIARENVQVLDVRTPEEYAQGHIDRAILADFKSPDFKKEAISVLQKDLPVAIYCRSGRRSAAAAEILCKEGFELYNLESGILGWIDAGKPLKEQLCGGYGDPHKVSLQEKELFEKVVKEKRGTYELISVSTQVVSGMNYEFFCKYKDNKSNKLDYRYITIYRPIEGKPEITSVRSVK